MRLVAGGWRTPAVPARSSFVCSRLHGEVVVEAFAFSSAADRDFDEDRVAARLRLQAVEGTGRLTWV